MSEYNELADKYSALPADIQQRVKDQRQGAEWALIKATPDELEAIIRLRSHTHYSTTKYELSAIIDRVIYRTVRLGDDYIKDNQ